METKHWLALIFIALAGINVTLDFGVVRELRAKPHIYHTCGRDGYNIYLTSKGGITSYPAVGECKP